MESGDMNPPEVLEATPVGAELADQVVQLYAAVSAGDAAVPEWLRERMFAPRQDDSERLPVGVEEVRQAYDMVQLGLFVTDQPLPMKDILAMVGMRELTGVTDETASAAFLACLNDGVLVEVRSGDGGVVYELVEPDPSGD